MVNWTECYVLLKREWSNSYLRLVCYVPDFMVKEAEKKNSINEIVEFVMVKSLDNGLIYPDWIFVALNFNKDRAFGLEKHRF